MDNNYIQLHLKFYSNLHELKGFKQNKMGFNECGIKNYQATANMHDSGLERQ